MTALTQEALERLKRDEATLPAGPWELWTSCSFRRIKGPEGKGEVLYAYNQRSDNHPDLSMPEDQLFALVRLRNALPALLAQLESAKERERVLTEALEEIQALPGIPVPYPDNFDKGARAARLEAADIAREALSSQGKEVESG